jgi:hypothetical protein
MPIRGFGADFFDSVLGTAGDALGNFIPELPAFPSYNSPLPDYPEPDPFLGLPSGGASFAGVDPFAQSLQDAINTGRYRAEAPRGGTVTQAAYGQNPQGQYASAPVDPAVAEQAIVAYITQAARARGIDPAVALRIAQHEGGLDKYEGNMGQFPTGRSHWAFQLHYGGAGTPYAQWGDTAGMGNDFTAATGFAPGDPNAWQAAIDFALDHAAKNGWGAWYGRGPAGVGIWDGITRR